MYMITYPDDLPTFQVFTCALKTYKIVTMYEFSRVCFKAQSRKLKHFYMGI